MAAPRAQLARVLGILGWKGNFHSEEGGHEQLTWNPSWSLATCVTLGSSLPPKPCLWAACTTATQKRPGLPPKAQGGGICRVLSVAPCLPTFPLLYGADKLSGLPAPDPAAQGPCGWIAEPPAAPWPRDSL